MTPKARLVEIDQELNGLTFRPTAGSVFLNTATKVTPWFLGAALPLGALAAAFGKFGVANDQQLGRIIGAGAAIFGGLLLIEAFVCLGTVIDHWVSEADSAKARAQRVTDLQAERETLTTSRPSQP